MAQSKNAKRIMNMVYGLGAAVVIIGALFKIQHLSIGPLTGGLMLTIGLLVEAGIFVYSAFEPIEEDLDWTKVYPELADGKVSTKTSLARGKKNVKQEPKADDVQGMLSKKLDNILKEAKVDASLVSSLGNSIKNFSGATKGLSSVSESIVATNEYNQQMSLAATQMETLNGLYKSQMDTTSKQNELNSKIAQNAQALQQQMESLATNLSSLNGVYGGMLTAMSKK